MCSTSVEVYLIKCIDHVLNTTVYSMTNTVPLIHLVRHHQLKFLGHILQMSKEGPARRYALYIPTIGKRRPGWPHTSYLTYAQRLLGDNEGAMQEQQIAVLADDRHAWRNLVVACSAADGWWWWWWWCVLFVCFWPSICHTLLLLLLLLLLSVTCPSHELKPWNKIMFLVKVALGSQDFTWTRSNFGRTKSNFQLWSNKHFC